MKSYFVTWEIDIEADNPTDAALKARNIQLDSMSQATVFEVYECDAESDKRGKSTCIDLLIQAEDNP